VRGSPTRNSADLFERRLVKDPREPQPRPIKDRHEL
jgi:hypothetical protein